MNWINVKTRKPKPGQDVLAWCGWCITAKYKYANPRRRWKFEWTDEQGENPIFNVTHWVPLPKPPKEKK